MTLIPAIVHTAKAKAGWNRHLGAVQLPSGRGRFGRIYQNGGPRGLEGDVSVSWSLDWKCTMKIMKIKVTTKSSYQI